MTSDPTPMHATQPRRPLIALFASLFLPGLGQIYCGEIARGIALLLSTGLLLPLTAWLGVHGPRPLLGPTVVVGALGALALYAYAVVTAYRSARALGSSFQAGPWNRGPAYLASILIGHVFVLGPLAHFTKANLVESFKIPSPSMMPTLLPGDRIVADKRFGKTGGPHIDRGAIAVFVYPNDRTLLYVKRVIGLPGDTVRIEGTSVQVNGVEIRRERLDHFDDRSLDGLLADHVAYRETSNAGTYAVLWRNGGVHDPITVTVPDGHVFVLGDNRDASIDSRRFGLVPLADITAVARQVLLSLSPDHGPRWRRTGKLID